VTIDWQSLLSQLGSMAVIVAAMAWIAKRAIEQWLAQRLQQHEADLARAGELALERFRYELRLQEARQSRLLTQQAEIIAGVFARLERVHESLRGLAAPILHQGENAPRLRDEAITKFNDFASFYHERGIWLERNTCDKLNELVVLLRQLLQELDYNLAPNGEITDRRKWSETYSRIQSELPDARGALDEHFRVLLGVSSGLIQPAGAKPPRVQ
jgi:hypothetical protein